jgi:SAM-dependent MidA family methyltransferase
MKTVDQKSVVEKYDEINRLEARSERIELLNKQSDEMQIALWQENIDRKTKSLELSEEQKEVIDTVRKKFFTVEFRKFARGKEEANAGQEYQDIMGKASQLLGREMMGELFGIIGDSKTMKWQ